MRPPLLNNIDEARRTWVEEYGARAIGNGADHAEELITALFEEVVRLKGITGDTSESELDVKTHTFIDEMEKQIAYCREHPKAMFVTRDKLVRQLINLVHDARYVGAENEYERIRKLVLAPSLFGRSGSDE